MFRQNLVGVQHIHYATKFLGIFIKDLACALGELPMAICLQSNEFICHAAVVLRHTTHTKL